MESSLEGDLTNNLNSKRRIRVKFKQSRVKNYVEVLKKKIFKCRTCGSTFKSKPLLFKHVETHLGTPISCITCKKGFNSRLAFTFHLKFKFCEKKSPILQFQCDQCPKVFRFKRHVERHQDGHKRNNCTYCELKLTKRSELIEHLQNVHSIKLERAVFKCDFCEKRYVKKRSLFYHMKQHAGNQIVCMECGHLSLTKEEHSAHFSQHDKDRPWQCEKCNDRFSRRQQYLFHIKSHDRYKCLTCKTSHASRSVMLRHKQRGHTVQGLEPHLKCPHCPNAFYRRYALQIHLRKHSEDKPMHCKYCNKSFRSPYLYFKHCASTVHEIKSPAKMQLVCEICGRLFMKKNQLELHLKRVHNQSKQVFTCTYCKHKTTSRKNMERHISLHLETKKECVCEQCGKCFYNLNILKDHVSYVHVQERQFKCNQCDKAFKRNSELIRHQTSHSEVRPHVCKSCGQAYKRSTHLKRHEKSQHGTVPSTRRVERLKKDDEGNVLPINETKVLKRKKGAQSKVDKKILSLMDANSGEMLTFEIPNTSIINLNQDLAVTIPYEENQSIFISNELSFQQGQSGFGNVLQEVIESSTTCDILLPENNEQNNTEHYLQNPYQYL